MSEQKTEFDWSPLGEAWWLEAAGTCGATPLQARFACCRHRGMTATGSAKTAGYSGDDDGIRQAGSRAAKSTAVMNMLAMARAESGGGDDGVVGTAEAKRILSRLARGSDPNVRIKALDSLAKIDAQDRQLARDQADVAVSPIEEAYTLVVSLPALGIGAALAMDAWYRAAGNITTFPFLAECAPLIAKELDKDWLRWRDKHPEHDRSFLDEMAAGPILEGDALVAAVKAKMAPESNVIYLHKHKSEVANVAAD